MMQTFKPSEYIKISVANSFGHDKWTWDKRIAWFDQNEDQLASLQKQADEPAMFFAGMQAWKAFKEQKPTGFPVSLDATASGFQLLAIMTGDRKAAELCNVINYIENGEVQRRDAYQVIYDKMCEAVGEAGRIERPEVKKAVMTALYGSEATPKRVFGEGYLLQIFEETMSSAAPFAWYLNKSFLTMWRSDVSKYTWVMPDGFTVHTKVMDTVMEQAFFNNEMLDITYKRNQPTEKGRSLGANTTHSVDGMVVREMVARCNYDPQMTAYVQQVIDYLPVEEPENMKKAVNMTKRLWRLYQQSGFLSVRILNYINPTTLELVDAQTIQDLLNTLPDMPFQVLTVHDCFRCLPNYGNDLRTQYNRILHDLGKSDILAFLLTQITGKPVKIRKSDPLMYKEILHTNYALS